MTAEDKKAGNILIRNFFYESEIDILIVENYHLVWNQLMPVIEKISALKHNRIIIIPGGYVRIESMCKPVIYKKVDKSGSLIDAVWAAVVDFIKCYNETKK